MAKEILLYSPIYSFTAVDFITAMEEARGLDVSLRINGPGGSVFDGWGMLSKIAEHDGKVNLKIDGIAASMYAVFPLFVPYDNTECLDVSRIMIHRADSYVETEEERALLASINKDLKTKMKARLDGAKFKEVTGYTIDEIFDSETVIDVWLNAKQAKEIGLIKKINKLTPKEIAAYQPLWSSIAACATTEARAPKEQTKNDKQTKNKTMNIETLKAEHPDLYKEVLALGVTQERDRVGAWMAFVDLDPTAVAKGIEDGANVSQKIMAEFQRKQFAAAATANITGDAAPGVQTPELPVAQNQPGAQAQQPNKEIVAFKTSLDEVLKNRPKPQL